MKRFQVIHPHDVLELPLTLEADRASVSWFFGTLRFHRGEEIVAEFVRRSWASWWEESVRVMPEKSETKPDDRPKPYTGSLTPLERPAGWMRS